MLLKYITEVCKKKTTNFPIPIRPLKTATKLVDNVATLYSVLALVYSKLNAGQAP